MSSRRGRPLARLLTLAFTGLLAGALGLMAVSTYALVGRHLRRTADHQLRVALVAACERLPGADFADDQITLKTLPDGEQLASLVADRDRPVHFYAGDKLQASTGGEGLAPPPGGHPHPLPLRTFFTRSWPVRVQGQVEGRLETGTDTRPARDLMGALARTLLLSSLIAWLAGLWVCRRLARQLTRVLEPVLQTVSRVAEGDLSARVTTVSGRWVPVEFAALGQHVSRMAERLQASFAAQERFVADASHELRTPLTAVGAMAEMLESDLDPEKARRAAATIARESQRMTRLVNDLLALSRASEAVAVEHSDLRSTLTEVVEELAVVSPERTVEVTGLPAAVARGAATAHYSIARNLLENALRYSAGPVTASLAQVGEEVVLEVRDHGCGIAPADLPHVRDRFYRADRSRQRATGGAGLGLSIVDALVTQCGGRVEIESQLGEGTTVRVFLPR